jgi:small subunit ribosomal protein S17
MKKTENKIAESSKIEDGKDRVSCNDRDCPTHGYLKSRGRSFKGYVTKKLDRRVVIEFERIIKVRKFERYYMKKSKLHARLPDCLKDKINVGDYIEIKECRPLSKIIHCVVVKKIRDKDMKGETK